MLSRIPCPDLSIPRSALDPGSSHRDLWIGPGTHVSGRQCPCVMSQEAHARLRGDPTLRPCIRKVASQGCGARVVFHRVEGVRGTGGTARGSQARLPVWAVFSDVGEGSRRGPELCSLRSQADGSNKEATGRTGAAHVLRSVGVCMHRHRTCRTGRGAALGIRRRPTDPPTSTGALACTAVNPSGHLWS